MCAGGLDRKITPLHLVLALSAGLDRLESVRNRKIDRLIIASLEMQEGDLAACAPIAAIEPFTANEIECAGDDPSALLGQHQQNTIRHPLAEEAEERSRQIRRTPFAVAD